MARLISNYKVVLTVLDGLVLKANRRSYAAASEAGHIGRRVGPQMAGDKKEERALNTDGPRPISDPWWGPDPITGYYRPVDWEAEIDPAFYQRTQIHKIKQPY
ncbi:Uncharacterized protein Adt_22508 [Abeliophyllum distichum]|uniref:Late embryogenesis abundant protein Lea5 n=1 Tax=Abeliophyllum distichum TaxID=126358 RepID=A0ABD1T2G2_9LAMI